MKRFFTTTRASSLVLAGLFLLGGTTAAQSPDALGGWYRHIDGDYAEAITWYSKVIQANPKNELAWLGRAMARTRLHWKQIEKSDPGMALQQAIEDDYLEALRLNPKVVEAAYGAFGANVKEEIQDYFLKKVEVMAAVHNIRGDAFMVNEKIQEGLASYHRAVQLRPDDIYLRNVRAFFNQRVSLGDRELALADYTWILEQYRTRPNTAKGFEAAAREQRGLLFLDQGKLAEARTDLDEAVRLAPNNPLIRTSRALVLIRAEELNKALTDLNEAVRLNPKYSAAYRLRAQVYERLGDPARAQADRETAQVYERQSDPAFA